MVLFSSTRSRAASSNRGPTCDEHQVREGEGYIRSDIASLKERKSCRGGVMSNDRLYMVFSNSMATLRSFGTVNAGQCPIYLSSNLYFRQIAYQPNFRSWSRQMYSLMCLT